MTATSASTPSRTAAQSGARLGVQIPWRAVAIYALAIFFAWTYPANQATANWTVAPPNWAELRLRWEYAHAVNAVLTFVGLCAVTLAGLTARK